MIFKEYAELKQKCGEAQAQYDDLLMVKSAVISRGGYHRELKRVNRRLDEAKSMLEERQFLLKLKYEELCQSRDPVDMVYYYRYIEHYKVKKISAIVHYSDTQVYRILGYIGKTLV